MPGMEILSVDPSIHFKPFAQAQKRRILALVESLYPYENKTMG